MKSWLNEQWNSNMALHFNDVYWEKHFKHAFRLSDDTICFDTELDCSQNIIQAEHKQICIPLTGQH